LATCGDLAISNDRTVKIYTVKINDIPFRNDVAENVILRITNGGRKSIGVYDKTQERDIQLSKIEEHMDVTIKCNKLLAVLSDLYKRLLIIRVDDNKYSYFELMDKQSCVSLNKSSSDMIDMCIDKDDKKVSYLLIGS
jgi:hypothetical protein